MKKKIVSLCLVVCLLAVAVVGGTMAYFTDTDEIENTMTLGNVAIEQYEQQWNDEGTGLVDFEQGKSLYPFVGTLGWDTNAPLGKEYRRFTMNNVVDKYVRVENTGESNAYVRTVFAFEMGDFNSVTDFYYNVLGTSTNAANGTEFKFPGTWIWGEKLVANFAGQNYLIMVAVHQDALAPGQTTIPSLLQVYMKNTATNDDADNLDGNDNGMLDILVLSQAVQAEGFADAQTALDTAFGAVDATNVAEWFN